MIGGDMTEMRRDVGRLGELEHARDAETHVLPPPWR